MRQFNDTMRRNTQQTRRIADAKAPLAGVRSTPVCYLNAGNPEEVIEPGFHRLDGGEVDKARGLH
jgi:hypothetical protein